MCMNFEESNDSNMYNKKTYSREELWRRLGVTAELAAAVSGICYSFREYSALKELLMKEPDSFVAEVRGEENSRLRFLCLYLQLAEDAFLLYKEKGIPEDIYFDTMGDILIWTENCERKYGETGIDEAEWLWRHVTLRLFRIGRLQYEKIEPDRDICLNKKVVRAGEKVLNLHIPQGGALTLSECRESIGRAVRFFPDFHEITCHSWLLNPNMQAILGPDSNIVQFQSLFEIYELDEDSRQAEERVFPQLEDDPGCYPESTALQRGLKKYLMEGQKFGGAYGRVVPILQ